MPSIRGNIPIVGILGGIGSGKSTVAGAFAALGAAVIDADRIARDVVAQPRIRARVRRTFGACAVDARGQLVLPKDVREQAGIRPGDKLAVVTMRSEGRVCCLSLMKTDAFSPMVRQVLGPLVKEESVR